MAFDPIENYREARQRSTLDAAEFFQKRAEARMKNRAAAAFSYSGGTRQEFETRWPQIREALLNNATIKILEATEDEND
jgi:hypothetical protein